MMLKPYRLLMMVTSFLLIFVQIVSSSPVKREYVTKSMTPFKDSSADTNAMVVLFSPWTVSLSTDSPSPFSIKDFHELSSVYPRSDVSQLDGLIDKDSSSKEKYMSVVSIPTAKK